MSSLREALESAFEPQEAAVDTPTPEPVSESPAVEESPVSQPRDESGKFAKDAPVEPVAEKEPPPSPEPAPVRKAPSSWKPAAQEAFLKADRGESLTPQEIKLLTAEAERRESDFLRGVGEFKSHADRARAYDAAIEPYKNHLQTMGIDAPTAINALMKADYTLRTADPVTKSQYFAQLAQQYGIDLGQVQQPPQVDPQTQYLMSQLNQLQQQQQMWQNQIVQQEQAKAQSELQSFATADKQHFDAVRNDMADLLESGKAKSLQDAYEMAVWMRPDIRQSLLDQQRADAQKKAIEQAQMQKAKAASVSVKGSSPASGGGQPVKGTLRELIASQLDGN